MVYNLRKRNRPEQEKDKNDETYRKRARTELSRLVTSSIKEDENVNGPRGHLKRL